LQQPWFIPQLCAVISQLYSIAPQIYFIAPQIFSAIPQFYWIVPQIYFMVPQFFLVVFQLDSIIPQLCATIFCIFFFCPRQPQYNSCEFTFVFADIGTVSHDASPGEMKVAIESTEVTESTPTHLFS
jgi:hypothetical protein